MTTTAIELFYSYAHEDEVLRNQLDVHLALLQQQGLIRPWHDREIGAGGVTNREISAHLKSASILLLLVSPDFIASDYCYGFEVQEALKRHIAGEARVIPIILRHCDWESAPFGRLQALPKNRKPVKAWSDPDEAFTDIAKNIRKVVVELRKKASLAQGQGQAQNTGARRRGGKQLVDGEERKHMAVTPTTISAPVIKKAVAHYHEELAYYRKQASDELGLRAAFQNLLADVSKHVNWKVSPERSMEGNIRPDGILRDEFDLRRGFWEAKGPKGNLEKEIEKKIADGYPLINTVFENTERAVLYQSKKRVEEYDLTNPKGVGDLLQRFLTYTEPDIENFEVAVEEFKERIPELAGALLSIIEKEQKQNKKFIAAFDTFTALCQAALNPQISSDAIKEMLVQHLLTERLFRTIFNNPDFVHRNAIAAEIEKVIQALTSRSFNRQDFLRSLDRFYVAIEGAAKGIDSWSERQHFLNTVYERFFQGFSIKQADTHGIVYTPQEIVDFMCASVDEVLKREFGSSIAEPGVQILDPSTGTGNFIVNLMTRIPNRYLKEKYTKDLFCNEITLLPYYIASLNIEHEYYSRMGEYEPFEGICFADTLELAEDQQLSLFVEENTERVQREKDAQIMIVIGNPPYNMGQKNENENNQNRKYPKVDERIKMSYAKDSKATLTNKLYDAYVKFFRWATDRLRGRDGIICLVSNNSFIDQIAFDGMRKHLLQDFSQIYHIDLHGNVRKNPKLSGTTHNVFGIQVGVGITIAIKNSQNPLRSLNYFRVPELWSKIDKLKFLSEKGKISRIEWQELHPDKRYYWITEGMNSEFDSNTFLPIGTKEAKSVQESHAQAIFKTYSLGVAASRDEWVYDFSKAMLKEKMQRFINNYNSEVFRWSQEFVNHNLHLLQKESIFTHLDSFINNDSSFLKWTDRLKDALYKQQMIKFESGKIRTALYRPFCKQVLYFDHLLNQRRYQQYLFFPTFATEQENVVIIMSDHGHRAPFSTLATNVIADLHSLAAIDAFQCFPYYTYAEDGSNRNENITNWALAQFQAKYNSDITKWDIFYYLYAMLHHPQYRERYAENLKHDLPHIPLLHRYDAFLACVRIGKLLMDMHLNYEQAKRYRLEEVENKDEPFSWQVEKMRLSADKSMLVVNKSLSLGPLPPACFEYRLGNRSALEWVIDQYQVSKDQRSDIESDPNNWGEEKYIVYLVERVVTVSVETVKLVHELAEAVTMEDWMGEEDFVGKV